LKITGPQRLAAQHINAGCQIAALDRFGIPLPGRGRLKSHLPDGDQHLGKRQVAVGAHQIKLNLALRFSQGSAAAGQARAEGRQLGALAQGMGPLLCDWRGAPAPEGQGLPASLRVWAAQGVVCHD